MEDDDDEGFGDFKFASFPIQTTVHNQPNGPDPSTVDDDDEWGDFVHSPGPARAGPPPPSDPFAFFSDQQAKSELPSLLESVPSQESGVSRGKTNQWEKPKGALPLSIFGEAEEESDASVDPASAGLFSSKSSDAVNDEPKMKGAVAINDLISNLYNQNSSVKTENGPVMNSNMNANGWNPVIDKSVLMSNQSGSGLDELNSSSNASDNKPTSKVVPNGWNIGATGSGILHNQLDSSKGVLNFDSNSSTKTNNGTTFGLGTNGWDLANNGLASVHNQLGSSINGLNFDLKALRVNENSNSIAEQSSLDLFSGPEECDDDEDEDGWEFMAAESGNHATITNLEMKADQVVAESGEKFNLSEMHSSWGMISSDQTESKTSVSLPMSDTNGLSLNLFNGNEGSGVDRDNVWDFRHAESTSQVGVANCKVDKKAESHEKAEFTFGKGHIVQGPKDMSVVSDGAFHIEGGSGFGFDPLGMRQNGFTSSSFSKEKLNDTVDEHNSSSTGKEFDADEDVWEFMDAGKSNDTVEQKDLNVCSASAHPLEYDKNSLGASGDNGKSYQDAPLDFGFSFSSSSASQESIILGSYAKSNQNSLTNESKSFSANEAAHLDESFWAFENTSVEANKEHKEELNVPNGSAHQEALTLDDKTQRKEMNLEKKEFLPLSLFAHPNLGTDNYTQKEVPQNFSTSYAKNSNKSSSIPINDLITSLYNEADQNTSVNQIGKASNGQINSSVVESDLIVSDDEFDDSSWEFKDASCRDEDKNSSSALALGESCTTVVSRSELNECIELYCKVKDALCSIVLRHIDNLQSMQGNAAGSGEDAEAAALEKEIEELYKELHEKSLKSQDSNWEQPSANLLEVLGDLQGPKLQVLESDLHLSERLSSVDKDLRSAVELLKHVELSLRILKMGSTENQSSYVSTLFKLVSVCMEELKHAAFIWKQALQTDVHHQILSRIEGKKYIISLGEIYRVVTLLKASVKLYKPWILLCSVDASSMDAIFSECSSLWSSSGLGEALQSISDIAGFEYDGTTEALVQSIKYIQDLDIFELQNYIFSEQEPSCRISLLKGGIAGQELVNWKGEHYFLKLANLLVNLVSCNPPDLPNVHVQ